jgi:ABC-type oligopeptide transport system substrate-binding subunit
MRTRFFLILSFAALLGCGTNSSPATQTAAPSPPPAPNESATLDAIKKINDAQADYFKRNRRYALTFDELVDAHLLTNEPAPAQTGYEFKLRPAADAQTYKLLVSPAARSAAARYFFTDQSGTVRSETGKDATEDSPKI